MSTEKRIFRLVHAEARRRCADYAMQATDGTIAKFAPPAKTRDQEEKYHAMISEIARKCRHMNAAFDDETWKRLLVDQFRRNTLADENIGPYWASHRLTMIPSLDGCAMVVLGEQTRKFPKCVASAFIEWLYAFGVEQGMEWSEDQCK